MKKFGKYILQLVLVVSVFSFVLDKFYTYGYNNSKNLNRFRFIKAQKTKHYNLAFVGSSRVVNTIVPSVFEKELNLSTINFGIMDAQPKDILAVTKLLKEYQITYDTLYVQLDYYFNSLNRSNFLYSEMLPNINQNKIIEDYFKSEENFCLLHYIPFYKFAKNDTKLGLRGVAASLFKINNKLDKTKGFEPLYGFGNTWVRELPNTILDKNKYIDALEDFKVENKLNIKYFVAPFRNDTQQMSFIDSLKQKFPDLIDFSSKIENDNYFKNGYHLNKSGAEAFSKSFATYLLNQ